MTFFSLSSRISQPVATDCMRLRRPRQSKTLRYAQSFESPDATHSAATARLVFTSGATCPRQPDQTPQAAIERGITFLRPEHRTQEQRRRPHPAARQQGRCRRVAPGWTRRAHRPQSMRDLPSNTDGTYLMAINSATPKRVTHRLMTARFPCTIGPLYPKHFFGMAIDPKP